MDLSLIRTFVEVAATGSFVAAADRLYVTQSAVSLRVQRLEDQLGVSLFTRSKTGADMTAQGREFEGYAQALLRTWEQARAQVSIPEGYARSLTIGAQVALWHRVGFHWVDSLREQFPDLGLRAQLGMPDALMRGMSEGVMQVALTYEPTRKVGLNLERVLDETLILVAAFPDPTLADMRNRYVFVDWGEAFTAAHDLNHPNLSNPGLTLAMGGLTARFLIDRGLAGYLPASYANHYIETGDLFAVPDTPAFDYPVWAVWRDDLDEDIADVARKSLLSVLRDVREMDDEQMAAG